VDELQDDEAGAVKRFGGDRPLIGGGVHWNSQHDFVRLGSGYLEGRSSGQGGMERGGQLSEQVECGDAGGAVSLGIGAGVPQEQFDGSDDGRVGVGLRGPRVPPDEALILLDGKQSREPVARLPFRSFEDDRRVIAAVGCGSDYACCSKINAKPRNTPPARNWAKMSVRPIATACESSLRE